jgi:PPP family 3-phenylpropionic acid transporter
MEVRAGEAALRARSRRLLIAYYFLAVGGNGGWTPFLGLWLDRDGHSGAAMGALLGLIPFARMISAPVWAGVADRFREGTRILQLCSVLTVLLCGAAMGVRGDLALGLVLLLFAVVRAPVGPVMDAAAVKLLEQSGADAREYGRIRLWGSLGFLVFALLGSLLVDRFAAAPLLIGMGAWAGAAALAFTLPRAESRGPQPLGPALRRLAAQPFFMPFLLACALHGTALATYDCLLPVHLSSLGLPSAWSGVSIAIGILVEVAVMAWARQLLTRLSPLTLITAAMAAGALRWGLNAVVEDPALFVAIQALHGLSFGAFWIGAVELLRRRAPPEVGNSAQALLTTSAYGVGPLASAGLTALYLDELGTSGLFLIGAGLSGVAVGLLLLAVARERRPAR